VLDFDQMSNAGVKSELENGHSVPRNVKVKKPCRDSSMQTGDYMRPEIEYYYVPAVEELSQAIVYDRIYYKYAEGQYGDLNVDMPLRILRQCVDDHASQLFEVEWYPKTEGTPLPTFFEKDQLLLVYPRLVLEFVKRNGVLYLGINKKEE
jgi:hypothetical protein